MSKEKQIEEMARDVCKNMHCTTEYAGRIICSVRGEYCYKSKCLAEGLYNAGYRKQSEGEWEEYNDPNIMCCSLCGWSTSVINPREYKFCPNCGAQMKGE